MFLHLFLALALVVAMMLTYLRLIQVVVDPDSVLWRLRRRAQVAALVRRETADLDREHASLIDEHRHIP